MSLPPTERRRPGDELGRAGAWRLVGMLGRGAMGAVFLGERAGWPAGAVKVLHEALTDADGLRRFLREAAVLSQLEHPGIVRVLDVGQERGRAFLVTERCAGEDLGQLLKRRGRLPPAEAARLALALAEALEHAHARGVVHRDLKPGNVIVGPDGRPRLLDFGVAHVAGVGRLTRTGEVLGTPLYMAPEQLLGERDLDGRTDAWALGVLLQECLTGERPFQGRDLVEVSARVLEAPIPAPRDLDPTIPPALEAVCRRALTRDRAARPGVKDLAAALRAWLEPAPPPLAGGLAPAHRAVPGLLLGVAGVALLAAVAALLLLGRGRPDGASDPAPAPPPAPAGPTARELLARAEALARACAPSARVLPLLDQALSASRAASDPAAADEVQLARADLLQRRGRWLQALAAAEPLLARPGRLGAEAGIVRGLALMRLERDPEGLRAFQQAADADPDGASGLAARGLQGIFASDPRGLEWTEAALRRDPGHTQARTSRGVALLSANRGPEALAELASHVQRAPDDPRVHFALGMARLHTGDPERALAAIDRAIALCEEEPFLSLLHVRLQCLLALRRDQDLPAAVDRYLERAPGDVGVLVLRGALRHQAGDPQGARGDWRRARELAGENGFRQALDQTLADPALREIALRAAE